MTFNKLIPPSIIITLALIIIFTLEKQNFESYKTFTNKKSSTGSNENPQKRLEYEYQMLISPKSGKIPEEIRRKEIEFVKSIPSKRIQSLSKAEIDFNFTSRGPINRGGRTRALGVDIRSTADNVTIIAAGVSGGIWRSTNNGAEWIQTSLPSQINSATCIVQDTRSGHQDTWYIGTGEARGNSASGGNSLYMGDGIFKSTNNGQSWSRIPSTVRNTPQQYNSPFNFVHALAMNPNTGTIFAAASNVIMKSSNGGASWTTVRGVLANNTQSFVTVAPNGIVYACLNSAVTDKGVWKSTSDGNSWSEITPTDFPQTYNRVIITVAPSNPDRLYLLAHTPGSGAESPVGDGDEHSIWISSNGGTSWVNRTSNIPNPDNVAGYASQNGYNMVMAVKPDDPDYLVFGGTNLHRSTDALATKLTNTKSNWIGGYALANDVSQYTNHHADQHALVFAPFSSTVFYSGNDGGVQYCPNLSQPTVVWGQLNNGYTTSQFYSIALDHSSGDDPVLLGGLQDNGHYFTNSFDNSKNWIEMLAGGDGAFTAIANSKTEYYIETQNGFLFRIRLDNNGSWQNWTVAKPDHETDYLFVNPYALDPNDSKRMYFVAGDSLWRNNDLTAIPNYQQDPTEINWDVLSNTETGAIITAVSVSKNPANIVYYGSSTGRIFKLTNAHLGNPSPIDISSGKGLPNGYISAIAVDESDGNKILIVFSNYEIISLYYSGNGGTSWTPVAGNLEQNPDGSGNGPSCRWASILNHNNQKHFFVATSAGLYSTSQLNGTSTLWVQESPDRIGVAVCTMVKTRDIDGSTVVATHGAGVFSADHTVGIKNREIVRDFTLSQNYPNPFNPTTSIEYTLSNQTAEDVSLIVYDIMGRKVATLVNERQSAGIYKVKFNANSLASGMYIYELSSGTVKVSKKMLFMK